LKNVTLHKENSSELLDLEHKEGQVILIDFWATWAEPCNRLTELINKHKGSLDKSIRIIRLAVDSDIELVKKYIVDNGMEDVENYNVSDATKCNVVDTLGGENGMIPYAVVVDQSGTIVFAGQPAMRSDILLDC